MPSESDSDKEEAAAVQPDIIASHQNPVKKKSKTERRRERRLEQKYSRIVKDYNFILQTMEIPDEEFKTARKFKLTVQSLLYKQFPACKLLCYRNFYLQLRNTTPVNEMLMYLDHQSKRAYNQLTILHQK